LRYRQALRVGFDQVRQSGLLTANHIIETRVKRFTPHRKTRKASLR